MVKIGIIGGSGLDNPNILKESRNLEVTTEYGKPSSKIKLGKINNIEVAILARHGRQHTIPPTLVNNRANIKALQDLGCTHIIATTAVGSLKEEIKRGDLVILDQFIDFTKHRILTFHKTFEPNKPIHCSMAEPFSEELRNLLIHNCQKLKFDFHKKGTVVTIEGSRFSTKAESNMFRLLGGDVINMSTVPEVTLANELKIPYVAIAMSTDYDCWKENEESVTWDAILEIFKQNVEKVIKLIMETISEVK